jgi:hypothetical protein
MNFAVRQGITYSEELRQWTTDNPHHVLEAKRCGMLVATVKEVPYDEA